MCIRDSPKGALRGWEDLWILVGRLRERTKTPAEMIRLVLDEGYETYLQTSFANFAARVEDLRRFAAFALRHSQRETLITERGRTSGGARASWPATPEDEDS